MFEIDKSREAFLAYYRSERERASKCINDLCEILLTYDADCPMTDREDVLVSKIIAFLKREEPYV